MKRKLISLTALSLFCLGTPAMADPLTTESAFKITGYIFDSGTEAKSATNPAMPQLMAGAIDKIMAAENGVSSEFSTTGRSIPPRSFAIGATFSATDKLTLLSTIGITQPQNEPFIYNSNFGWELDLGVAYKLLNNLTYEVHFGYMDTGEAFTESPTLTEVEKITILTNKLTMSF
ncbi:MAG: hypothetical protein H8E79_07170 [Desulfobulbaceae bacterium]|uniref:Outer membrane protein beta-barrel domain-containing protein n=1 Tax=Candidatus Desulfatifera sulfidica TaxID=2841691 RepID=A0A8J6TCT4_9BACT|nr:hypothetical protein [Candidatus Desulfatifera sulfidica]